VPPPKLKDPGLGQVDFEISCTDRLVRHKFQEGVARLHHLDREHATRMFVAALAIDPGCAIAHWGLAMAEIRPFDTGELEPAALSRLTAAVEQARALGPPTPRERAYVDAVAAFVEAGPARAERLSAWATAQEHLHQAYPEDVDAASFAVLARLATPRAHDVEAPEKVASRLALLLEEEPEHPGLLHAMILACDSPALAPRAAAALDVYKGFAPAAPRAWHDIGRIYLHLGRFEDAVEAELASSAAARRLLVRGAAPAAYAVALDHLLYAYLQSGWSTRAEALPKRIDAVERHEDAPATARALAAIPARLLLEQERWEDAARLPLARPATFDWDRHPAGVALTRFARGIGAARAGDLAAAADELAALEALRSAAVDVEVEAAGVAAWVARGTADEHAALSRLARAADREDASPPDRSSPAPLYAAREMLADILLDRGRAADALQAYEACLRTRPNRRRTLSGAVQAAQQSGNLARAQELQARAQLSR
jgi:tetratricopeptide (TPR) repeat protein